MKVIIATVTKRSYGLDLLYKSLSEQTYKNFDWLVCSDFSYAKSNFWISKVPYKNGDYFNVFKSINSCLKFAKEYDLFINTADLIYLPKNAIEHFVNQFKKDPKICLSIIGDHYKTNELIDRCWIDPRRNQMKKPFEKSHILNFDLALASFAVKGAYEVGGLDEEFDKYGMGDKEMLYRMTKIGYQIYLDSRIQFKRLCHDFEKKPENHYEKFLEGHLYFNECLNNIDSGARLRLNYI